MLLAELNVTTVTTELIYGPQAYKLSLVDMCEIARNSVLQSGFEHSIKVATVGGQGAGRIRGTAHRGWPVAWSIICRVPCRLTGWVLAMPRLVRPTRQSLLLLFRNLT